MNLESEAFNGFGESLVKFLIPLTLSNSVRGFVENDDLPGFQRHNKIHEVAEVEYYLVDCESVFPCSVFCFVDSFNDPGCCDCHVAFSDSCFSSEYDVGGFFLVDSHHYCVGKVWSNCCSFGLEYIKTVIINHF